MKAFSSPTAPAINATDESMINPPVKINSKMNVGTAIAGSFVEASRLAVNFGKLHYLIGSYGEFAIFYSFKTLGLNGNIHKQCFVTDIVSRQFMRLAYFFVYSIRHIKYHTYIFVLN